MISVCLQRQEEEEEEEEEEKKKKNSFPEQRTERESKLREVGSARNARRKRRGGTGR